MISRTESLAEERRDLITDAVNATSAAQSLREAIASEGQTIVSPSARHGVPINTETGARGRVLRYGDKYQEDSVYGF